jgi:nucleoside-diphosphate-sugar epimerase
MTEAAPKTALVAGATGVVGRRLVQRLLARGNWRVIGASRRAPDRDPGCEMIAVDLADRNSCAEALGGLRDVTHIFYAGRHDHQVTAPEPIDINFNMLRNLVEILEPSNRLEHVHLLQGMKVYGSTLGPFKTPAKESDPRILADNFYYHQEDFVAHRQRGKAWTWTASRPQGVCDSDPSIARSMAKVIAVFATISRELGIPLRFPGNPDNYTAIYQVTDAAQLAEAIIWMSTEPRCANQAFNVTNGDYIRWVDLWPVFAEYFRMALSAPRRLRLAEVMPERAATWERMVALHGLKSPPYDRLAIWSYGDFIFGGGYDQMSDLTKLRSHGFHELIDTETMFLRIFDRFCEEGLISRSA